MRYIRLFFSRSLLQFSGFSIVRRFVNVKHASNEMKRHSLGTGNGNGNEMLCSPPNRKRSTYGKRCCFHGCKINATEKPICIVVYIAHFVSFCLFPFFEVVHSNRIIFFSRAHIRCSSNIQHKYTSKHKQENPCVENRGEKKEDRAT